MIQNLRPSKTTPELSERPQRSRWKPSLCTFLSSPSIVQLLHTASPRLSLAIYPSFLPPFLSSLLLPPLLFPASWLSFWQHTMDDRWEGRNERRRHLGERKNGPLFGVAGSNTSQWATRISHCLSADIQSTVNSGNDTALCALLNIH